MRVAVVLVAAGTALPAAAQPDTQAELEAFEKKLTAAHAAVRASVGCVVVSRSDQYPKPPGPPAPAWQLGGFDADAFRKADPSPARVALAARLDLADPQAVPAAGAAGGVVIDPAGLVLTTYGTIEGATKVYVRFAAGGSYADIHAADARSDLAVLKLLNPPPGLAAVPPADVRLPDGRAGSKPNVAAGKLVVVATPWTNDGRPSGGLGVLGEVRRPAAGRTGNVPTAHYYQYGPMVELDARANPGVNGAAVLTPDGHLFGLTTAAAGVDGDRGRVLPLDANVRRVVEVLRRGEEVDYGFLGVAPFDADARAVDIGQTTPGGPADLADLRPGNRIVRINGYPAEGWGDLILYVGSALAGNTIEVEVARGGPKPVPVRVTLAKLRNDLPSVASVPPAAALGLRVDYASVVAQQQQGFGALVGVPPGVVVREVVPGGPAAARFKALGDAPGRWLVTHVNDTPVNSPAEFRAAAGGKKAGRLTVVEAANPQGRSREVAIP